MSDPDRLLEGRELARRLEAHAASAMALLAPGSAPIASGLASFGGVGSYLNKACGFTPDHRFSEEDVAAIEGFFTSRGVEPRVELSPYVDPGAWALFAARGFVLLELETRLARALPPDEDLRGRLAHGWPEGLVVERIDRADREAIERYARASASGFVEPGAPITEPLLAFARTAAARPSFDGFIAQLDGRTVGGGAGDSREGIVALVGASVAHDARGRGVQQALMVARMERGRARGATLATVTSAPGIGTERNALRLGFRVAYTLVVLVKRAPGLAASV